MYHQFECLQICIRDRADGFSESRIDHLQSLLNLHHTALATAYGEGVITINQHKILHLPEQIRKFGPPSCFSVQEMYMMIAFRDETHLSCFIDIRDRASTRTCQKDEYK
jgi:hypothetical protein